MARKIDFYRGGEMDDQDRIIEVFRPALRSQWFLFFGLALGPAVLLFGRQPVERPLWWAFLSFLCLGLILHRLSLKYTLSEKKITLDSWWGRGPTETVSLALAGGVLVRRGLAGRAAGTAHIEIPSLAPDEAGLTILGCPPALAARIEELAARARAAEASKAGGGRDAPG